MKTPAPPSRSPADLCDLAPARFGLGRTGAERNCISNIHGAALGSDEAAFTIAWLVREGLAPEVSGVTLKDESGKNAPACHSEFSRFRELRPFIAASAPIWRERVRLRDAVKTCYTLSRQIYRMFSRVSADLRWPT
jgi:hypothetical protein